jgi:hypothetical protein
MDDLKERTMNTAKSRAAGIVMVVIYVTMLLGLGYSLQVVTSKVAYASTCNCTEELQDAEDFCLLEYGDGGVDYFQCPEDGYYVVYCAADPHRPWANPCD